MDKPKSNDKSQLNVLENIRSDGYNKITQEIEINSGYVNWNLNYADTGALVKIKRERVSYDVRQLDDVSSSEHKICAEIEFETKNSHKVTNEESLVTSIDQSRYFYFGF
jgi:hypothetical protein